MHDRSQQAWLILILLVSFAMRVIGLDFGTVSEQQNRSLDPLMPVQAPVHPDEYFYVAIPALMHAQARLNPEFFENPSFLIYLNLLTYYLTGEQPTSVEKLMPLSERSYAPFRYYVIGRIYSALGGLIAVAASIGFARHIGGNYAAIFAGLLTALSFPLVQHAHYATTSSLAAGFSMLSVWAAALAFRHTTPMHLWLLAGVAAGLAAGNRYNAAAISIVLFVLGMVKLVTAGSWRIRASVLGGYLAFPLVFIMTTPFALLDFPRFWDQFSYIFGLYTEVGSGVSSAMPPWILIWRYVLLFGMGGIGIIGYVFLWPLVKKHRAIVGAFAAFILPYSLIVLDNQRVSTSDQLTVPILPVLLCIAALGWARLDKWRPWLARFGVGAACILLLTINLQWLNLLTRDDSRQVLADWIYSMVPEGSHLLLAGGYNVAIDPTDYTVTEVFSFNTLPDVLAGEGDSVDLIIVSDAVLFHESRLTGVSIENVYLERLDVLAEQAPLLNIPRTRWLFDDITPNNASYWHQPGLQVYCWDTDICSELSSQFEE